MDALEKFHRRGWLSLIGAGAAALLGCDPGLKSPGLNPNRVVFSGDPVQGNSEAFKSFQNEPLTTADGVRFSEFTSVITTHGGGKDTRYSFAFDGGENIYIVVKEQLPIVHDFYDRLKGRDPEDALIYIMEYFQPLSFTTVDLRTNFGIRTAP